MSVVTHPKDSPYPVLLVKGAAEFVLDRCTKVMQFDGTTAPLTAPTRAAVTASIESMASKALRILAIAVRTELPREIRDMGGTNGASGRAILSDPSTYASIESDLVFVGLVGMLDPPRTEVRTAI